MLHVWNIYLHVPQKWPSFVGKYSSTMEHMGWDIHDISNNPPVSSNVGIPELALGGSRDNPGFGTMDFMPKEIGFLAMKNQQKPLKRLETKDLTWTIQHIST